MWKKRGTAVNAEQVCLEHLGVKSTDEINQWFIRSRNDQYKIEGLDKAVEIMNKYREKNIVICGDYDADGTMAVSILMISLRIAGFKNVAFKIPRRHTEGYGLNMRMVEEIAEECAPADTLIITVDNGIAACNEIAAAKEMGFAVVVTDHHLAPVDNNGNKVFGQADVVIDPEAFPETADFDDYCGAGLAYKIARALIGDRAKALIPLAMVAIIADKVSLREENYVLARDGLKYLNKGFAPEGLNVLKNVMGLEVVTEHGINFKIAPAINAPGRLLPNGAEQVVKLMMSTGADAEHIAREMETTNKTRIQMVADAAASLPASDENDISIVYMPGINQGIMGLVASEIVKHTKRAAIVVTDTHDGLLTGSARSVVGLNIKEAIDVVKEKWLSHFGGHAMAAGLTLPRENFEGFKKDLTDVVNNMHIDYDNVEDSEYDAEIHASSVADVLAAINKYAPFGDGNLQPVFRIMNYRPSEPKRIVKGGGVRFSSFGLTAIGFGMEEQMSPYPSPETLTLYGNLSYNYFRGRSTPQIEFCDFEI